MHVRSLAILLPVALAASIASMHPAAAQPAQPTAVGAVPKATANDASRKEARDMAELLQIPQQTRNIMQNLRNTAIQATVQAGKPLDEAGKIVDEVLMPDFNAQVPQLSDALLEPWAANLSAADVKGLHEFYASPLGGRLLAAMPNIGQQSAQAGVGWQQRVFQESARKHADELRARGLKF